MSRYLPTDYRNALYSLFRHRMVSRALRDRPELVKVAQDHVDGLRKEYGDHDQFVEWHDILQQPLWRIRILLTSRDERMFRLRIDSPFIRPLIREFGFDQDEQRRRIIEAGRRLVSADRQQFVIERPVSVHDLLTAWSRGKLTNAEISAALHLDDEDDLQEIASDNDIALPSPPPWFVEQEAIVDRSPAPGQS